MPEEALTGRHIRRNIPSRTPFPVARLILPRVTFPLDRKSLTDSEGTMNPALGPPTPQPPASRSSPALTWEPRRNKERDGDKGDGSRREQAGTVRCRATAGRSNLSLIAPSSA